MKKLELKRICNKNSCTCWFDGWFKKKWKDCCETHDKDYIKNIDNLSKAQADKKLFDCVRKKGCLGMAIVMWLGNNLFSWYYWRKYRSRSQ